MICNGGKQGCTMKGFVSVDAAWQAVGVAMQDVFIYNVHRITGATPEKTMRNMGRIAETGTFAELVQRGGYFSAMYKLAH